MCQASIATQLDSLASPKITPGFLIVKLWEKVPGQKNLLVPQKASTIKVSPILP